MKLQRPQLTILPILVVALTPAAARAELFDDYTLQSSFSLDVLGTPQGSTVLSNLSDGRIVAVLTDEATATPRVYVESASGSRSFNFVALLDSGGAAWSSTGPFAGSSFMEASPGGAAARRFAVGNGLGTQLAVFTEQDLVAAETSGTLPTDLFSIGQLSAAWQNDRQLAVNGFMGGATRVALLDTDSPIAAPTINTILASGVDSSGGVAFDGAGNLYVGEGFDFAGLNTGEIRRFTAAQVQAAVSGGTPLAFGAGQFVGDVLAASPLVFDAQGNLWVGGADAFDFDFDAMEEDFFALIQAVTDGAFDPNNPNIRQFGTPDVSDGSSSYFIYLNDVTGEVYVHQPFEPVDAGGVLPFPEMFDVDNQFFQVFAAPSAQVVPEPSSLLALLICAVALWLACRTNLLIRLRCPAKRRTG